MPDSAREIERSEIKVIFEADMKWLEPDARKEMDSALARFDKIDAVYAIMIREPTARISPPARPDACNRSQSKTR